MYCMWGFINLKDLVIYVYMYLCVYRDFLSRFCTDMLQLISHITMNNTIVCVDDWNSYVSDILKRTWNSHCAVLKAEMCSAAFRSAGSCTETTGLDTTIV